MLYNTYHFLLRVDIVIVTKVRNVKGVTERVHNGPECFILTY